MIKYLRDKIIGHPAVFSRVEDLPIDDEPIKRSHSQSSLNDGMSTSTISNETTTQVEKLLAAGLSAGNNFGRRPPAPVSSPIIIPKKPPRSNASSQSSSSYTSVADQMSSLGESSMPSDDVSMPTLPPASQRLEHSAARDRISVKNKRRQPVKQRLSTLRETEDNEVDLFASKLEALSSTPDEEPSMTTTSHIEHKVLQPLIDLSDLGSTRDRLRKSGRPARDRSADNILLATNTNFTNDTSSLRPTPPSMHSSSVQRSVSFKRPQEMNDANASKPRPILKPKRDEHVENEPPVMKPAASERATPLRNPVEEPSELARSRSSSQEHIYDNLDVFKRTKPVVPPPPTNQDAPASTGSLRARETPLSSTRSRPVTVFIPTSNDNPSTNEFENVFDQFKKRGSIRRAQPPAPVEEVQPPPSVPEPPKSEPVVPAPKAPSPAPNRRKTVGGVCLTPSNKVATNNDKPAPSWIDIAKEKQNKFQSIANEKDHENVAEQQPLVAVRKATPNADMRSNRKSMFDPPTNQSNVHALERDSIRALKAGNPNRINNLIQFFDK